MGYPEYRIISDPPLYKCHGTRQAMAAIKERDARWHAVVAVALAVAAVVVDDVSCMLFDAPAPHHWAAKFKFSDLFKLQCATCNMISSSMGTVASTSPVAAARSSRRKQRRYLPLLRRTGAGHRQAAWPHITCVQLLAVRCWERMRFLQCSRKCEEVHIDLGPPVPEPTVVGRQRALVALVLGIAGIAGIAMATLVAGTATLGDAATLRRLKVQQIPGISVDFA
eukprot:Skav210312  [mRNA]  locus=scaffold475:254749:257303:- [translate_table: standard]